MRQSLKIAAPIVAVVLMLLAITWAGILTLSKQIKQTEIERSFDLSEKVSSLFAEQVARTIDSIDSLIDFTAYQIRQNGFAYLQKSSGHFSALKKNFILQIAFVDPDGLIVAADTGPNTSRTDLRDREHIRVHLDGNVEGLYIGAPVLDRISDRWSIPLTKKIVDSNGNFIGIILASIDPFYFQRLLDDALKSTRLVSLFRSDGILLSRSENLLSALENRHRRADFIDEIGNNKVGRTKIASADGEERFGFFRRVPNAPFVVISGEAASHVAEAYAVTQKRYHILGAVLTLILMALGCWLFLFAIRLMHQEQQARYSEQLARRAEQSKSAFLATMSHEIRTPLNAVVGFANLLEKTPLNDEQRSFMKTMRTSALMLSNIVTDVLDFSKLESGLLEIEKNSFNLHECCNELKKMTSVLIEDKPINVRMICASNIPEIVIIDGSRFYQALLNVCGNAAKFTQAGEILISGRVIKQGETEKLVVEVSDTGPGISEAVQAKLFTPFEQGEVAGKLRASGTGLGLSISRYLLEQMGGSISVKSALGSGSMFKIELPFERPVAETQTNAPVVPMDQPSRPLRILVADDARASRMLLRIILQKKGHIVAEAEDGVQALELMQHEDFDLVFLDMQMPRLGGMEVIRSFDPKGRTAPLVVAITAQTQPEDQKAAYDAGISVYITKPLQEEQLDKVIRIVSDRKVAGL
jgi:signal transduction histidine kinase/ActR/RegA family two-component response regulator